MDKVETGVGRAACESKVREVRVNFPVPETWGLFEAVERLLKPTDETGRGCIREASRLLHEYVSIYVPVKEINDHVHLL